MKIFIGADHRGFQFKSKILGLLNAQGYKLVDVGTDSGQEMCDYPKIAYKVSSQVAKARGSFGILVCMSGIGQAMAANKVKGAYAALCYNPDAAMLARQHNNANVLVLGAKFTAAEDLAKILDNFLTSKFEGGRHLRRVNQIKKIEKGLKI